MSKENNDSLFPFLSGMFLGAAGGALLGLLFAPKKGEELSKDAWTFIRAIPGKVEEDIKNPDSNTRQLIERARVNVESQVEKAQRNKRASRIAKAKEMEELSAGYEYN